MSTSYAPNGPVGPDTQITVKVLIDGQNRRFKFGLRDLGAHILPQKLRFYLDIPTTCDVKFERFSDSAGTYIPLDSANPAVYKQLYRAAKAKLKLRLRATVVYPPEPEQEKQLEQNKPALRNTYLDTVLSHPPTINERGPSYNPVQSTTPPNPPPFAASRFVSRPPVNAQAAAASSTRNQELSRPTLPSMDDFGSFSIDCNNCGESVPDKHYHCGVCANGDFDLCQACIDNGVSCDGENHWLIKRTIKNGRVYPSITEIVPPKNKKPTPPNKQDKENVDPELLLDEQRTCNSCIQQLPASSFVTCEMCPDFDLCFFCLKSTEHGHHPAHTFMPVDPSSPSVSPYVTQLCQKGRGVRHDAVCDGCDAHIDGVRHKCLTCPDFDYCSTCALSASDIHPGHRFAPLYDQLSMLATKKEYHRGVYCDGPLCAARARKSYICGDRYKCAVCDDTDFCANCEAFPGNPHNQTHPLIKMRMAIRHVSITTVNELDNGSPVTTLGDRPQAKNASTETVRSTSTNAATQVQPVAETKPVEMAQTEKEAALDVNDISKLDAKFEAESTPDGSTFAPDRLISQSWTLKNNGAVPWPAGCAVYYIGGDEMRKLNEKRPSSTSEMAKSSRSNLLEHTLEPGNTGTFTVVLKSPAREGRAISYWRLKTPEGVPFGHKLWVDITVANKAVELSTSKPALPKDADTPAEKSEQSSTMIFPKLEKESPESSIENIKKEPDVPTAPSVVSEDQDLLDDLDSMALEDDSTEDGFMTDEEYDILDAEDEDYLMQAQRAVNHQ